LLSGLKNRHCRYCEEEDFLNTGGNSLFAKSVEKSSGNFLNEIGTFASENPNERD
jgi:hypothetical protein